MNFVTCYNFAHRNGVLVECSDIYSQGWIQEFVRGTENEFGALWSCEKATGGNHFEYSEVHVLQFSITSAFVNSMISLKYNNNCYFFIACLFLIGLG